MTGNCIGPRLYVAVGISGQPNHLLGVRGAGTILAINSDPDRRVYEYAVPALAQELSECGYGVPRRTAALSGTRS